MKYPIASIITVLLLTACGAQTSADETTAAVPAPDLKDSVTETIVKDFTPAMAENFTKAAYDETINSGKLVLLFFTANWCPLCQFEKPATKDAASEFSAEKFAAFFVNWNDDETDKHEKQLASDFGVGYQQVKVLVRNGERLFKSSPSAWSKEIYVETIDRFLN